MESLLFLDILRTARYHSHMEIDGEVIVDQEIVLSMYEASSRASMILSGIFIGGGLLLIPFYFTLKRRRKHARISNRRADRAASQSRGRKVSRVQ